MNPFTTTMLFDDEIPDLVSESEFAQAQKAGGIKKRFSQEIKRAQEQFFANYCRLCLDERGPLQSAADAGLYIARLHCQQRVAESFANHSTRLV